MDRDTILKGERRYLETLDYRRRPLEERLFSNDFSSIILERGYLLPQELGDIAYWKWYGAATKVKIGNSPEIIERFTHAAITHHDDARMAAWLLSYLYGVHVRMASSILTVLFPGQHTVMDARAWSALEEVGWAPDLEQVFGDQAPPEDFLDRCATYEIYRDACAKKAAEFDVSLRTLDRFLYIQGVISSKTVVMFDTSSSRRSTKSDYAPLIDIFESDAVQSWHYEDEECGAVLIEQVNDTLSVTWVYLPEYDWFRGVAMDSRTTEGIPLSEVLAFIKCVHDESMVLMPGFSNHGLNRGWTSVSATTLHELEAEHHGFEDVETLRAAFLTELTKMCEKLSELLE